MNERLPLFVFGTLRRGQCNHHLLAGRYTGMRPARLHGYAKLHPLMIGGCPGSVVTGELYFLRSDACDRALCDCDDLEGIPPGQTAGPHYRRVRVTVETPEGPVAAWAYVHPETAVD